MQLWMLCIVERLEREIIIINENGGRTAKKIVTDCTAKLAPHPKFVKPPKPEVHNFYNSKSTLSLLPYLDLS